MGRPPKGPGESEDLSEQKATRPLKNVLLFKFKEGENFNHRHTLSISRIKI
jgi:hypothetical protein